MTAILIILWVAGPAILDESQRPMPDMEYCQALANAYNQNVNMNTRSISYCVLVPRA